MNVAELLAAAPFASRAGYGGVSGAERLRTAQAIVSEALANGAPLALALALVVNADSESGLNPRAVGDNGRSVGPFQLSSSGGGRGMTADQRMDPRQATQRILAEYAAARGATQQKDHSQGGIMVQAPSLDQCYASGGTVAQLAGLFAFHVERPADLRGERTKREARARSMFPGVADLPARSVSALADGSVSRAVDGAGMAIDQTVGTPRNWWYLGSAIVVLAAGALLLRGSA